ncbi:hypothetical protein R5E07_003919 [Vibrio vulnificus]|nr:hypothetical protein [Vibrio vulnificus]ELS9097773.1 hypothetical protein [Vibrio vulnificus]
MSTTKSFTNAVETIVIAKLLKRLMTSKDKLSKYANQDGRYDPTTKLAMSLKDLLRVDAASKITAIYLAHKQLKEEMQLSELFTECINNVSEEQKSLLMQLMDESSFDASNIHLLELKEDNSKEKYPTLKKYLKVNHES